MNNIVRSVLLLVLMATNTVVMAKLSVWDYRIKLVKDTGGLNIVVRTFNGPAVTVGLENKSGKTARCSASFVSYPHTPTPEEIRSVSIAAGKKATLAYPAINLGGEFSTAFVNVKCEVKD
jgi:hypothetical protein